MSKWYEYLVAAYGGKDEPARRSAYLMTFEAEEPSVMLEAAKAAAQNLKFFPRISELAGLVRGITQTREADAGAGWVSWARREKQRRAWTVEYSGWPSCPDGCGERVPPGHDECPFCKDRAEMVRIIQQEVTL
jgi:hypothetical protein